MWLNPYSFTFVSHLFVLIKEKKERVISFAHIQKFPKEKKVEKKTIPFLQLEHSFETEAFFLVLVDSLLIVLNDFF